MSQKLKEAVLCYHCGETCENGSVKSDAHDFCCEGCKTVYTILNKAQLCDYYALNERPGINRKKTESRKFKALDDEQVKAKFIQFREKDLSKVTFYIPQMHCSSCIWLLENLHQLNPAVLYSRVDFLKKEVNIGFKHDEISLREVAELCDTVGYEPHISLHDLSKKNTRSVNRSQIYKIGISGFCFGNIMMLSFPEYFSGGKLDDQSLNVLFSRLNLVLSLPVFFYCASDFFISAYKSLKQKFLNIDAPIALAVLITFIRSIYEITSGTGAGYLDSMSGIVFFMLAGRYFQDRSYDNLTFNRDYTSYFPLGTTIIDEKGNEKEIPLSKLKIGHRVKIRSGEIIPADAILFLGEANIDYSFVSGESIPVVKQIGEIVYAGGKQCGGALELEIVKEVSQSYLTQLWNNDAFTDENKQKKVSFIHSLSRYFTVILFSIALAGAAYWYFHDPSKIMHVITSVLIVACPCALLLSATFANGSVLSRLRSFGFYARNAIVLEKASEINTVIFDKTGTITMQKEAKVIYQGEVLDPSLMRMIRSLLSQSSHPLSRAVYSALPPSQTIPVMEFKEIPGSGLSGSVKGNLIKAGSSAFVKGNRVSEAKGSEVFVSVNGRVLGSFKINSIYRTGLSKVISSLKKMFRIELLSGDNESEKEFLSSELGKDLIMHFNNSPQDKLNYIVALQQKGEKVMMIGDGLNDAGALKQCDIGVAVTDNINNFSPACDVIMEGKNFSLLPHLLEYCRKTKYIIIGSFVISILYNIIGLYFAFFGLLEPVIAAILMPVSSVSIILYTSLAGAFYAQKIKRQIRNNKGS